MLLVIIGGGYYLWSAGLWPLAPQVEKVKFAMANALTNKFIIALIKDKELDKKNGLDLEMVWSDPGESERKLAAKEEGVEIGDYNPISLVEANASRNIELRSFAPIIDNYFYFVVKKDSRYQTLQDLKGAKLALRPKASAAYKASAIAMKLAGLDLEKDFKLTFGSLPQSVQFLQTGEADATLLPAIDAALLEATGGYRLIFDLEKKWEEIAGGPMPFVSVTAHKDWIEKNPKKVERIRKMMLEAAELVRKDPSIISNYKDVLGIKTDDAERLVKRYLPALYPVAWNAGSHSFTIEKAVELGVIKSAPKEDPFLK